MSTSLVVALGEILQGEYNCELAGLPHGLGRGGPELHVPTEKLYQLKDAYMNDFVDQESEEFMMIYLDTLRIFKHELDRMDTMSDEFCSSYLEALKPGSSGFGFEEGAKGISKPRKPDELGYESYHAPASHKSRRGNLPKSATNLLKKWLFDHLFHPYPTEEEKSQLSLQTGLNLNQISNWFINARRRTLQPMLESVRNQQQENGEVPVELHDQMPPVIPRRNSKRKAQQPPQSDNE